MLEKHSLNKTTDLKPRKIAYSESVYNSSRKKGNCFFCKKIENVTIMSLKSIFDDKDPLNPLYDKLCTLIPQEIKGNQKMLKSYFEKNVTTCCKNCISAYNLNLHVDNDNNIP